jgi:hypothetical protein
MCGGDNSTCDFYQGFTNVSDVKNAGYRPLLVLPKEARSIKIEKYSKHGDSNYLAVKNSQGKISFLSFIKK